MYKTFGISEHVIFDSKAIELICSDIFEEIGPNFEEYTIILRSVLDIVDSINEMSREELSVLRKSIIDGVSEAFLEHYKEKEQYKGKPSKILIRK